jgi:hypothetical protein
LLRFERKRKLSREKTLLLYHLSLAELVAKVTYNASEPRDPFDEDSGWWIVVSLKGLVDLWNDEEFSRRAWMVVSAI